MPRENENGERKQMKLVENGYMQYAHESLLKAMENKTKKFLLKQYPVEAHCSTQNETNT